MRSLYEDLKAAGCTLDSHESDLYVRVDPNALAILQRHGKGGYVRAKRGDGFQLAGCSMFRSEIDGMLWIDVPFAFAPYWKRRAPSMSSPDDPHGLVHGADAQRERA